MEEYLEDELADNLEDEKRLTRADSWVRRKVKSAKNGVVGSLALGRVLVSRAPRALHFCLVVQGMFSGQPQWLPAAGLLPAAVAATQSSLKWRVPGGVSTSGSNFGPCFDCGMVGHLRKSCPDLKFSRVSGATNKS